MPWCTGCDRFLSPSTVTAAGACPRCGATVDPGRGRPPDPAPTGSEAPGSGAAPEAVATGGPAAAAPAGMSEPGVGAVPGPADVDAAVGDEEAPLPIPWHFKLLVGAIALYLGWRAFQGIDWLVGRF